MHVEGILCIPLNATAPPTQVCSKSKRGHHAYTYRATEKGSWRTSLEPLGHVERVTRAHWIVGLNVRLRTSVQEHHCKSYLIHATSRNYKVKVRSKNRNHVSASHSQTYTHA